MTVLGLLTCFVLGGAVAGALARRFLGPAQGSASLLGLVLLIGLAVSPWRTPDPVPAGYSYWPMFTLLACGTFAGAASVGWSLLDAALRKRPR